MNSNMSDSEKIVIDQKSFMYVILYMSDENAVKITCQHYETQYGWFCSIENDLINNSIELDKSNFHYKISPKTLFSLLNDFKQHALNPIYTFQFPEFEKSTQPIVITLITSLPNNKANDVKYISLQPNIDSDIERLTLKIEDCETQIKLLRKKQENDHEDLLKLRKTIQQKHEVSDDESAANKRKSASKPKPVHQEFIACELKLQRKKNPGLKNEDYMRLAAKKWHKYKEKHGIVTSKITAKKKMVDKEESE